jgi:hypothetical protein
VKNNLCPATSFRESKCRPREQRVFSILLTPAGPASDCVDLPVGLSLASFAFWRRNTQGSCWNFFRVRDKWRGSSERAQMVPQRNAPLDLTARD